LAYPVKEVALAITGILLVIYDGNYYDAALLAINAATRATVEDETVNLRDLVFEVTQFITKAELKRNRCLSKTRKTWVTSERGPRTAAYSSAPVAPG
jgi:exosome complex RNA-binding protein Rrp42 (RNase PH superfamily)